MKKFIRLFMCCFAVLWIGIPAYSQTMQAKDLIYLTEIYPPHNFLENEKLTGVSVELLQMMWKKLDLPDVTDQIKIVPWARGMIRLKREPNVVLFAMGSSPERLKRFNWIGPYHSHSLYLIGKKKNNFAITGLDDAASYKIGAIREDIGHQVIIGKGFPKESLELSNHQTSLYKKLSSDRIDMICFMEDSAFRGMEKAGLNPDDYELVYEVFKLKTGFGFGKKVPKHIIDKFQTALDELVQDGSAERILKKYKLK